jgi:predicted AlkP superfamily pyrophosphatase or phosphodiesterase
MNLIIIMIDGVSADYFAKHRARLPHLNSLAEQGLVIERLGSITPATSLPGRTTILTGDLAHQHGIYGNVIWDGERFRYANPDDVRTKMLTRLAMEAKLDVAVLGYGMVRPEDATVFHHAWWANEMLQRARDRDPIQADEGWLRTSSHRDPTGRLAALSNQGFPDAIPNAYAGDKFNYFMSELTGDQTMMAWTAGLATSKQAPDLIVTEILTPDSVQHMTGYESLFAHWSIFYADTLVGSLLERLERSGRLEDYTLAILSDHGHAKVHTAIHFDILLPDVLCESEGGTLYVAVKNKSELANVTTILAEHHVERWDSDHVVPEYRDVIATFVAPEGSSFERNPKDPNLENTAPTATGIPRYPSMHGFKPGTPGDDRFAVFWGKDIPKSVLAKADPCQITPSFAKILGLPLTPYRAEPIF